MNYKILIVDDEPSNLRALQRLLAREYTVVTAGSGTEALELILQHDFAAIISDHRMPGMTGIEFLKRAAQLRHQTVRLLLTGYTDVETLVDAINSGAVYQYLTKPWVNDDLVQTIRRALAHYESIRETYRSKADLERVNRRQEVMLAGVKRLWDEMLKLKGSEFHSHAVRMSDYSGTLARILGLEEDGCEEIAAAARMLPFTYADSTFADVVTGGPVGDDVIYDRTVELAHALDIFGDLAELTEFRHIADTIKFANEHFDGSGFPERLVGDRIPLASRIIAAARAYDLVTAVGLHGRKLEHDQALAYITSGSAERFDPNVVQAMMHFDFVGRTDRNPADERWTVPAAMPEPSHPALIDGI